MITGKLKGKIDLLWLEFFQGGITNPMTVVEQMTFLMFSKNLDTLESLNEKKAKRLKSKSKLKFVFNGADDPRRWKNLLQITSSEKLLKVVRDQVFPHFKDVYSNGKASVFAEFMGDAQLMIQKPSLLHKAIKMIEELNLDNADTKGDLYEYVLGKMTTSGIAGQFRTPRHIIDLIVALIDPKIGETICDPACGTAGFLVRAYEYLRKTNTSKKGIIKDKNEPEATPIYTADELSPDQRKVLHKDMLYGFDFDVTMLRIASMNLVLHGMEEPNMHYCDTMSTRMLKNFSELGEDAFDIILANPPFKGVLDHADVDPTLTGKVKTKKSELLFLVLMLRMLKLGGRCGVIIPQGVLFGSGKAFKDVRKMLVENNQLEAVISLPSGVFKPYAGVATAILIFTKGDDETDGQTENVLFYDVQQDGYALDDNRTPIDEDDLPDVQKKWKEWNRGAKKSLNKFSDRTRKAFNVPAAEMRKNNYDLSINRYKEVVYEEVAYDAPQVILDELEAIEVDIVKDLKKLRGLL